MPDLDTKIVFTSGFDGVCQILLHSGSFASTAASIRRSARKQPQSWSEARIVLSRARPCGENLRALCLDRDLTGQPEV